jgi:DNA polymerase-3 subunit epsilon/ATP-dependent DNA helicase DinG
MRGELVAIDLETTGFDPEADKIIEVGAVRIRDGEILDEYGALVNPGIPIPSHITQLTGIRTDDVLNAPIITQILPALRTFVGNAPLVGHNIGFDLGFLNQHHIVQNNLRIDTYDLASILLPRAPRYSLASLASESAIELEHAHRALDDARAAARLYWRLWQKMLTLPYATLYEINAAAQGIEWDARPIFEAALRDHPSPGAFKPTGDPELIHLFGQLDAVEETPPATPNRQLDSAALAHWLQSDGALAQSLPNYEERPQQIEMATAIANAFNTGQHLMAEAGTGTGKTLAYLLPAVLWATQNHEPVVISTNTINLQDQILTKDIPVMQKALGTTFRAAVVKGRGNYLCPRRLAAIRRRRPTHVDELRTLAKVLVWLTESNTGDRSEITLRGPVENDTWGRLSAEDEGCTIGRCHTAMQGACPFFKARKAAENAHVLVINHALLLADATSANQVLPSYRYLIVDEAHHLEDATTQALSFRLDEATLRRRLAELGSPRRGLLGDLLNSARTRIPERDFSRLETIAKHISTAANAMETHIQTLFNALRDFFYEASNRGRSGDYSTQIRITPAQRALNHFGQMQAAWNTLREFFDVLSDTMRRLTEFLGRLESHNIPDYNDLANSTAASARYLETVREQLNAFINDPASNHVYWINVGQNIAYLSLHSAPLHVGGLMQQYLWNTKAAVICTSATLQTDASFDYIRERLSADTAQTLDVGSPFDYQNSTLIYIPDDIPDPNEKTAYQQAVERGLIELAAALNGRVLGLFTSYTQLRQTAQAISPRLALGNITVYDQSDGSSRQALLDGFRSTEKAVLLGTKSFWEGVDIPGDSLSALVITRLPFAVPTEPIFAARSETYKDSFNQYALPDAILRFRQGFGRLIRAQTDRGVVAVFDRRVISKSYGSSFLEALPQCTIQYGSLRSLPEAATSWLNRTKT